MYNNYTPLQQRQLALQEYSNTQSTYLLVCASARRTALKATLTDQLHRKFRLVDRLGGELTASVDGVLLAAEDVELMSTALMFFAKALQDGADYAVCNAVFGFGGATALYQSQPLQAQNRCAVVSRTLLERCRAAAHDPENVPELLALAAKAMQYSYSPYSKFKVGACLLAADGRVFTGCNIENASYGATNCAERTALFKAVSEGAHEFVAIAIATEKALAWPCGICRQALCEFAPHLRVITACGDQRAEATLDQLLYGAFGPVNGTGDYLGKD